MIQYIHGTLCEISDGMIIVEAGGIGYGINVPASVIGELPAVGTEVRIYTYYSVKEDSQSLFGFLYKEDREMFVQLIGINGIGPKGALAILSALRPDDLRMAIITGDAKAISSAQGIGKKTAERVILDLKDKVGDLSAGYSGSLAADLGGRSAGSAVSAASGPMAEAIDALTTLGYSRMEAGRAVGAVVLNEDMTTEDILRAALKTIRL